MKKCLKEVLAVLLVLVRCVVALFARDPSPGAPADDSRKDTAEALFNVLQSMESAQSSTHHADSTKDRHGRINSGRPTVTPQVHLPLETTQVQDLTEQTTTSG